VPQRRSSCADVTDVARRGTGRGTAALWRWTRASAPPGRRPPPRPRGRAGAAGRPSSPRGVVAGQAPVALERLNLPRGRPWARRPTAPGPSSTPRSAGCRGGRRVRRLGGWCLQRLGVQTLVSERRASSSIARVRLVPRTQRRGSRGASPPLR
jgi:hypothetical protein